MCGIAGWHLRDVDPDEGRATLDRMLQLLIHRGPDESGTFLDDRVALGSRRLRVLDLASGRQPLCDETGELLLVANGEIYGFETLRRQLEARGHRFRTRTDVEVILALYREHGLDVVQHIDGMFAFALWDRAQRRLVLARDRFGIKPLFYSLPSAGGRFAFASEIRPLLLMPDIGRELDPAALDDFFRLSYVRQPRTAFRDVRKLPPGWLLVADPSGVRSFEYWRPPAAPTRRKAHDVALHELDVAIGQAVGRMLRSDVPVGLFLSGGLDSATVAHHMTRQSSAPVRTFCARFAEPKFDEGLAARQIAAELGTTHHEVWIRPEDALATAELCRNFGEPFADPAQIASERLAETARPSVTVVLSGEGGDELLGGYRAYAASLLADRAACLPRRPRERASAIIGSPDRPGAQSPLGYRTRKFLLGCVLPAVERHALWRTIFLPDERRTLYSTEFRDWLGADLDRPTFPEWRHLFRDADHDRLAAYQKLDLATFLADGNLVRADRTSMAHSIELRLPLLDLDVFGAARRLPPELRLSGLRTKVALRRLAKPWMPRGLRSAAKRGFSVPLAEWFRGPLRRDLEQILSRERIARLRLIDPTTVQRLLRSHADGSTDRSRQLWSLCCFVWWHEALAS